MENKLKEVFQKKLTDYQAPVDASAWTAIQSGISGGAASTVGSTGLLASLGAKIAAIVVAASLVGAAIYFTAQHEYPDVPKQKITEKNHSVDVEKQQVVEKGSSPVVKQNHVQKEEKHRVKNQPTKTQKQVQSTSDVTLEKPTPTTQETLPTPPKSDEVSNTNLNQTQEKSGGSTSENAQPTKPEELTFEETIEQGTPVDFEVEQLEDSELSFQLKPSEGLDQQVDFLWDFGNGTTSNEETPTVYYDEEGNYSITLSLIHDGKSYQVAAHEAKAFYPVSWEIQNIFTPNDDLYNQYFDPAAKAENIEIESVVVYDNTQKVMFSSNDQIKKWSGKLPNGQLAPQGYYYYQVIAKGHDGKRYTKKGKVYLITGE